MSLHPLSRSLAFWLSLELWQSFISNHLTGYFLYCQLQFKSHLETIIRPLWIHKHWPVWLLGQDHHACMYRLHILYFLQSSPSSKWALMTLSRFVDELMKDSIFSHLYHRSTIGLLTGHNFSIRALSRLFSQNHFHRQMQ